MALPFDTIEALVAVLNTRVSSAPVFTAGRTNSRPVPAVIVDDWSITYTNPMNTSKRGAVHDGSGTVTAKVLHLEYTMEVEILVRHDDEVDAHKLLGALTTQLGLMSDDPRSTLHEEVNDLRLGTSGNVEYQYREPQETEINQTIALDSYVEIEDADVDVLEDITGTDLIDVLDSIE